MLAECLRATMHFNKKKILLLLLIGFLILICLALSIVLLLPSKKPETVKEPSEICIFEECLIITGQGRKSQSVATSVCIPNNCVSVADFIEYGRICVWRKCLSEGRGTNNKSRMICINKSCLTSTMRMERLSQEDLCLTQGCVDTASEILNRMDSTIEPCDDFYSFACGGFIKKNQASKEVSKTSSERMAEDRVALKVRGILEQPYDPKDSDALKKAKIIYRTCINTSYSHDNSVAELKVLFIDRGIGVWPTLEENWNSCRLDLETRMAKLNAHGVDSFFRLVTEFKGMNNTLYGSMYIAPPLVQGICDGVFETDDGNLTDFANDVTHDYSEAISRVLDLLGAHENFTMDDINDMFRLDYSFCNVTKLSRNKKSASKISFRDLISIAPQINWGRWHNVVFRNLGLAHRLDSSPIHVYNIDESFPGLIDILENTPPRTIANYLSWKFVLHHLGFLSSQFAQVGADYRSTLITDSQFFMDLKPATPRWKQCVKYVRTMMPMAIIPSYLTKAVRPEQQKEMNVVAAVIRNAFNETFNKTRDLLTAEKVQCIKKINSLKFQLLYPEKEPSFYDKYYSEIGRLSTASFLQNGIALRKFQMRKLFQGVLRKVNASEVEYVISLNDPFSSSSWTDFRGNVTRLSFAAVENTGIDPIKPKYLNFGSFGNAVASGIAVGFDLPSIRGIPSSQGSWKNWTSWPYYAFHFAEKRKQCFEKHYLGNRGALTNQNMASIVDNIAADNQGAYIALKAYRGYVKKHGREKLLPGLMYMDEQIFFIRYAQTWCDSSASAEYTQKMRVNAALSNLHEFAETFLCPEAKNMNPVSKCRNLGY